jgi:hypothetical protein
MVVCHEPEIACSMCERRIDIYTGKIWNLRREGLIMIIVEGARRGR